VCLILKLENSPLLFISPEYPGQHFLLKVLPKPARAGKVPTCRVSRYGGIISLHILLKDSLGLKTWLLLLLPLFLDLLAMILEKSLAVTSFWVVSC